MRRKTKKTVLPSSYSAFFATQRNRKQDGGPGETKSKVHLQKDDLGYYEA